MSENLTFRSAVDSWIVLCGFVLPVFLVIGALVVSAPLTPREWMIVSLVLIPSLGLPVWLFMTTRYELSDNTLVVRAGPFRWNIPRGEISSVEPSHSLLSSPALSMDRLEIKYSKGKSILVSPKDKADFKRALGF